MLMLHLELSTDASQALQDELEVARVEVVHMAREKDIIIAGKHTV
jgi:hypothetical protein